MTTRREFSAKTKAAAWDRAGGICECGCGRPFTNHPQERPHYDHVLPCALGGNASLENCQCIRIDCHKGKTADQDIKQIAKARRGENKRRNITTQKRLIPGSKGTKFKAKIGGGVELRN